MPSPDSWEFWAEAAHRAWAGYVANRENILSLATIIAGLIGIPLLAIRTFAANRSANASLKQAEAANQSAVAALKQAETALKQAETAAKRHEEQTKADRESRITESFATAGEQLGSNKLETRLGGIYTLERIAGESKREYWREYWPIMETLTAFVRERAPWPSQITNPFVELQVGGGDATDGENTRAKKPKDTPEPPKAQIRPATDIQAVLTVLGRRDETAPERYREERAAKRRLDLRATDLRGADFPKANLEGAVLREAHLEGANLWKAHLQDAVLIGAHLQDANLTGAHLQDANLTEAHLENAKLWKAGGLTQEQLNLTSGDYRTRLPFGGSVTPPEHWRKAPPYTPDNPRRQR